MLRIAIDPNAGPVYQQIVDQIEAARARGEIRPGDRLPAVRALAEQIAVNPNTVAHAYRLLRQAGVLAGQAGQGTLVASQARSGNIPHQRLRERVIPAVREALADGLPVSQIEALLREIIQHEHPTSGGGEASDLVVRCLGSHDFCLDALARRLGERRPRLRLEWTAVGSLAGLVGVGRGEAQLASTHLLDRATGDYNHAIAQRLLPEVALRFVTLAHREQGLLVRRGNPLTLRAVADLARPGVRFAARQPGSGTRVLLDSLLAAHGLTIDRIAIVRELTTHLEVAAAIAGGGADVGLGVRAAASALDLDFVPLLMERFDLAFRRDDESAPWLAPVLETLASPTFRADVEALEGYDGSRTGWFS